MRKHPWWFSLLLSLCTFSASAQKAPPPHDWEALRNLLPGENLRVDTQQRVVFQTSHHECVLVRVMDTALECEAPRLFFLIKIGRNPMFIRDQVGRVSRAQVGKSGLAGLAIGAGAGVVIGAVADARNSDSYHTGAVLLGLLGALLGQAIGSGTDFLAGPVLYEAP